MLPGYQSVTQTDSECVCWLNLITRILADRPCIQTQMRYAVDNSLYGYEAVPSVGPAEAYCSSQALAAVLTTLGGSYSCSKSYWA
jgi:hypothetical protein